jgi:hypothetical protein
MAAPEHVPSNLGSQPRRGLGLPPARPWTTGRPSDLGPAQPRGHRLGSPGPDQGYALRLAERFEHRLEVAEGETRHDAVAGCVAVALRRASVFGRAPMIHDLTLAFTIWGFLGQAPPELVAVRTPLFQAAAHDYEDQRAIAEQVPEEVLRAPHGTTLRRYPAEWRLLLGLAGPLTVT